jgi:DNA-binding CsgD family transcriptional regulator
MASELKFYTNSEVAAILKCSKRTLQRHAHRIGKKKDGVLVRWTEQEIKKLVGVK